MAQANRVVESVERLARSVDLLVRLKPEEVKGGRNQREMTRSLGGLGATGGEIASLLGISRTTVDPELSKARGSNTTKGQARPRSSRRKG